MDAGMESMEESMLRSRDLKLFWVTAKKVQCPHRYFLGVYYCLVAINRVQLRLGFIWWHCGFTFTVYSRFNGFGHAWQRSTEAD